MKISLIIFFSVIIFISKAQIIKQTNKLTFDIEAGYRFNDLKIASPNHFAVSKGWLYPKNSYFFGINSAKPLKHFTFLFSVRNNRFIYVDESFTLPKSYTFTKTDFIQITPSIEKRILKKLSVTLGVNFNFFVHRSNLLKHNGRKSFPPKPAFENIYYSTNLSKTVYGIDFGIKYKVNKLGFLINTQLPINAAANYLIKPAGTGGVRNHLQFHYSNINIGVSYNFLSLPRNYQKSTNFQ